MEIVIGSENRTYGSVMGKYTIDFSMNLEQISLCKGISQEINFRKRIFYHNIREITLAYTFVPFYLQHFLDKVFPFPATQSYSHPKMVLLDNRSSNSLF